MNWQLSVPAPALLVVPVAASLDEAHAAIKLWEHYSRKVLDSAQRLAVELMLATAADDRWAARSTGRCEPRQNGKGDELEVVEAWGLLQRGEWIYHTAHEIPTAESAHKRLADFLMGHKDLRRKVRHIRWGNGQQAIQMVNDGIVVYRTRTAGGGRGLDDISRIVVDEAQYAQVEQLAAAMPILAVNPNPQTNFAGTGGIAGRSEWWWTLRKRALRVVAGEEEPGEFAYLEHSAETVELNRDGKVVSVRPAAENREARKAANPAWGIRIEDAYLDEELKILGPALFSREHLCVWDAYPGADEGFLPYDQWETLAITDPTGLRSVAYGLAVGNDNAAVGSAARLPNGTLYIDTVEEASGTEWILPFLTEPHRLKRVIRIDPAGAEGALIRPLKEAGVKVEEVPARAYQQACGEVLDTVKNGTIRHLNQPELNRAVRGAQRRDVGKSGSWVWTEPSTGVSVTTLKAATIALTGVTAKRPPRIHMLEET